MKSLLLLMGLVVLYQGCGGRVHHTQTSYENDIPADHLDHLSKIANEFWGAAARQDSAAINGLTSGTKPIEWAQGKRDAFPNFFEATAGKLTLLHGYFLTARSDTAIIEVSVPWHTCRPPVHSGSEDHYLIMFTPLSHSWRIVNVWSDPC